MTTTTASSANLIRAEIWSTELKEQLRDDLMAMSFVDMLDEFPDGDQFNIPSVGDAQVDDYLEDQDITLRPLDTGEFTFTIDKYISSGTYITRKNEQDMFYMNQLVSSFVPKQRRAILEHFEDRVLSRPEAILGATANGQYEINNAYHRYAGGNSGAIELADFAYALYALKKANVPQTNLIAIVDPSVEYIFNTTSTLVQVSDNPRWEGIIHDGIATGMRFVKNVYGFDVYTSNYLPTVTDDALPERDGSTTFDAGAVTAKANYFFSAAPDVLPWKAAWRQEPTVDTEWVPRKQRTEFYTTARYGTKLYRPENMVSVVSNTAVS